VLLVLIAIMGMLDFLAMVGIRTRTDLRSVSYYVAEANGNKHRKREEYCTLLAIRRPRTVHLPRHRARSNYESHI